MSLTAREQQALDGITDGLASSAPKLATMLATFTRLTSDEEMPAGEKVAAVRRRTHGARRLFQPAGLELAAPLLCTLIAVALIAVAVAAAMAVAASRGSGAACVTSWETACSSPAPVHSSRPARKTAAGRALPAARPAPAAPRPAPAAPPPGRLS